MNVINKIQNNFTVSVFIVSTIATMGSLYLSLGLGLVPCKYCWYQRIFMYPMAIISLLGIYKNIDYADIYLIFSSIGVIISGYHSYMQIAGSDTTCSVSCATVLLRVGGVLSIPNLAFIAFSLILLSTILVKYPHFNQ